MQKPKLCYVLPRYDERTDTHFNHIYQFLARVGEGLDIFLFVESSTTRTPNIRNVERVYVQRFHMLPLRVIENIAALLFIRLRGYRTCYVHYSFLSAFNAALLARMFGGRVYYWNCGLPWLYRRTPARETFERLTYRMVSVLVTGTASLAREYSARYGIPPGRVRVMPNWIDLERFRICNSGFTIEKELRNMLHIGEEKIILFVHRLSERKGADLLPDIMKALGRSDVVLVVIGDGPERQNIERRAAEYGIRDHVRLLGAVPNSEMMKYYAIADALVMPSREEGFPRVLLEAMASGVPFVASAVGGVRDIVPPEAASGLVAHPDPAVFARTLNVVLSMSDKKRSEVVGALRSWVAQYDIARAAEAFCAVMT